MTLNPESSYWDRLAPAGLDAAVIDPNDRRGHKNSYLAALRNATVLDVIMRAPEGPVLDFGCGTGGLTAAIAATGRTVLGVDISPKLLKRARERPAAEPVTCVLYDGCRIPVVDNAFAIVTTYVVLTHIIEDTQLAKILAEFYRLLTPGGWFCAIEQVRKSAKVDHHARKHYRTKRQYLHLLETAGFSPPWTTLLRHGHSPFICLATTGLIPSRLYPLAFRIERRWSQLFGAVNWDYSDVLVLTHKL